MLQNRVNPYGDLITTPARGSWTGTRGTIHNYQQEIVRPFKHKAWITCLLEFKGRKRTVMSPNKYTELFFLDEATAFAAGHRPCCECRRADFNRFKTAWLTGNPEYNFTAKTAITQIDDVLQNERIDKHHEKTVFYENFENIPAGCFVVYNDEPHLVYNCAFYLWTPFGYGKEIIPRKAELLKVLTPRSIVNAFIAGYQPQTVIA